MQVQLLAKIRAAFQRGFARGQASPKCVGAASANAGGAPYALTYNFVGQGSHDEAMAERIGFVTAIGPEAGPQSRYPLIGQPSLAIGEDGLSVKANYDKSSPRTWGYSTALGA